jgi:hypothetical protein
MATPSGGQELLAKTDPQIQTIEKNVVSHEHCSESSMDPWKDGLVAPQAVPMCVTVAGAQWL